MREIFQKMFLEAKKMCQEGYAIDDVIRSFGLSRERAQKLRNMIHLWLLWLDRKYDTEIAAELGVSKDTVRRLRTIMGLPAHYNEEQAKKQRVEESIDIIEEMLQRGYSVPEVIKILQLCERKAKQIIQIWILRLAGCTDEQIAGKVGISRSRVCKIINKILRARRKKEQGIQSINPSGAKFYAYARSAYRQEDDGTFVYVLGGKTDLPKKIKIVNIHERISQAQFTGSSMEKIMKKRPSCQMA